MNLKNGMSSLAKKVATIIGVTITSLTTTNASDENQNFTANNEPNLGNISIEAAGRKPMPVLKLSSRDLNESRFVASHDLHIVHTVLMIHIARILPTILVVSYNHAKISK